jgi:hypothetical protein
MAKHRIIIAAAIIAIGLVSRGFLDRYDLNGHFRIDKLTGEVVPIYVDAYGRTYAGWFTTEPQK